MQTYRVGIIGLGRMGSTIDDEGHSPLPYSTGWTLAPAAISTPIGVRLSASAGA